MSGQALALNIQGADELLASLGDIPAQTQAALETALHKLTLDFRDTLRSGMLAGQAADTRAASLLDSLRAELHPGTDGLWAAITATDAGPETPLDAGTTQAGQVIRAKAQAFQRAERPAPDKAQSQAAASKADLGQAYLGQFLAAALEDMSGQIDRELELAVAQALKAVAQ
jgi:hypothetical protein